ncbi:MAG: LamG-like jellyroll fold domain-containing protein [Bacteroidota bacterium]
MKRSFFLLLVFYFILGTENSFAQRVDFESGLQGYYPFNGTADDKSSNGNDGIVNGAKLITDRFGAEYSAYSFDGKKASIRIPFSKNLDLSSNKEYSISLWIRPRDINTGCILLRNYDYGIKWNGMTSSNTIYSGPGGGYIATEKNKWGTDKWYHIVMIQEANKLSYFIDGQLNHSSTLSHSGEAEAEDIFIGRHPYFWGSFSGDIDDICIFSRALNKREIDALYQIETMPIEVKPKNSYAEIDTKSLEGTWQGIFSQPGNSQIDNFAYWITLEEENGMIKGNSRTEVANSEAYGLMQLIGSVSDYALTLQEKRIMRQYNPTGFDWCLKFTKLRYNKEDKSLRGEWYADNCKENGSIILYKTNNPFNFYNDPKGDYATLAELAAILKKNRNQKRLASSSSKTANIPAAKTSTDTEIVSVVNTKIALDPIRFYLGSAQLTVESKKYLTAELIPFLLKERGIKLNVSGHTDNTGSDAVNLQISISRARSVVNYMIQQGISSNRMQYEGYGKAKPIADNKTTEGRSLNRRVEFQIIGQ